MMSIIVISIACFINIAICIHATMKIIDIHCARHEDEDLQDYVLNLMQWLLVSTGIAFTVAVISLKKFL